jgi:hypothetical protein
MDAPKWLQSIEGKGNRASWTTPVSLPVFNLLSGEYEPFIHLENIGTVVIDKSNHKYILSRIPADPAIHPFAVPVVAHLAQSIGLQTTHPKLVRYLGQVTVLEDFILDQKQRQALPNQAVIAPNSMIKVLLLGVLVGDTQVYPMYFTSPNADNTTFEPILQKATGSFSQSGGWGLAYDGWEDARVKKASFSPRVGKVSTWIREKQQITANPASENQDATNPTSEDQDVQAETWMGFRPNDLDLLQHVPLQTWTKVAQEIQSQLSDATIDAAIQQMPAEVASRGGADLAYALEKRRDELMRMATWYFNTLQQVINERPDDATALYQPSYRKHDYSFAFNDDDGTFIGWQTTFIKGGFKKPFNTSHQIEWNIAPKTFAFNIDYAGRFNQVLGQNSVWIDAYIWNQTNKHSFYILGNETPDNDESHYYYNTQRWRTRLSLALQRETSGFEWRSGVFGEYQHLYGEHLTISPIQEGTLGDPYKSRLFVGTEFFAAYRKIKNKDRWFQSGFRWENTARFSLNPENTNEHFANFISDASVHHQFKKINASARVGGAHLWGDFPFYAANRIGQLTNLRGFWQRRFGGRSIAYFNSELRVKAYENPKWFLPGRTGLLTFLDSGRVWTDGETSAKWHTGYGVGMWSEVVGLVLSANLGFSKDYPKGLPLLRIQWQF